MATLTLDTLEFVTELKEAGITEKKARAIVAGLQKASIDNVATKQDVGGLETKIAELETRMTWKMFAAMGLLFVALKYAG